MSIFPLPGQVLPALWPIHTRDVYAILDTIFSAIWVAIKFARVNSRRFYHDFESLRHRDIADVKFHRNIGAFSSLKKLHLNRRKYRACEQLFRELLVARSRRLRMC